jgi:hypothetical protein
LAYFVVVAKKINLVLSALLLLTALSVLRLAFVRRSRLVEVPLSDVNLKTSLASGLRLSVYKVYPDSYTEDTYQLAYMVKSLLPASVLDGRRLIDLSVGEVAVGLAADGQPGLQTCLLDTGRVAVTNKRMVYELNQAISNNPGRRRALLLQGVLLGRPLQSRPCLLIQLSSDQPLPDGDDGMAAMQDRFLKAIGPVVDSLKPISRQELSLPLVNQ